MGQPDYQADEDCDAWEPWSDPGPKGLPSRAQLEKDLRATKNGWNYSAKYVTRWLDLMDRFRPLFDEDLSRPCRLAEYSVELKDPKVRPVGVKSRRMNPAKRKACAHHIKQLLAMDIIEPSSSDIAAPVHIAYKKDDENGRFCVDFSVLNTYLKRICAPMKDPRDVIARMQDKKGYISIDFRSGYHQMVVAEACRDLLSFTCPEGQFRYKRAPMGSVNVPQHFQSEVSKMMDGLDGDVLDAFMDDCSVYGEGDTQDEWEMNLLDNLEAAFIRLELSRQELQAQILQVQLWVEKY